MCVLFILDKKKYKVQETRCLLTGCPTWKLKSKRGSTKYCDHVLIENQFSGTENMIPILFYFCEFPCGTPCTISILPYLSVNHKTGFQMIGTILGSKKQQQIYQNNGTSEKSLDFLFELDN